ncbi:bromodomain-containing protein 7 [Salmo salar]|uniref:Bromodomain-containing protein 7 n=1 Tax=Salmo salar TaxID=8030 RepID=B5X3C9_SALSA|nr:bromodomain-containing protein 7 [Salmo salar]ACI33810.1 Bromodomain-containing protein 7 [Salmo salar]ACN11063.1 Bromodomain-containing protein 7 [Salmo salar]|eukprot:NP_001135244.1 bromodomain-containing protein 7 [Salmo salar]
MGKKHKKHKSEKYEEYGERPLKLVLKVAGNEVTTGSSSFENTFDEHPDLEKHKDKKKKKKKDKERNDTMSPVDDKKKKKMTKKKKGQDADTDLDDREASRTPIRSDLASSLNKVEEKELTPLQEALSQLIRQLQRKDPSAFFSFPVTDLIAPGYSTIIKRPMDFGAMKEKVKNEYYQSLEELKVDFRIMCENAMIYNKPETIYHKAARKLLHSGMKILRPERLESLRQSIEFMADLENPANRSSKTGEEVGNSSMDQCKDGPSPTDPSETAQSAPNTPRKDNDSKDEVSKVVSQAEKELEEIRKLIDDSGGKLSSRGLESELDFERRKSDGSTTLAILNPVDLVAGDVGYCPVKLGMMSNRLQSGINTLQGFKEDKRNMVTPVSYMNYGPYTSYAPAYDSSFANIGKEDSDLIYSFYGEEASLQGSESLSEFLSKSEEHMYKLADNLLDALTNGEHSKTLRETRPDEQGPTETSETGDKDMEVVDPEASKQTESRLASLGSVIGLGLDLQTPPDLLSEEAQHFQQKLDETTKLLRELQEAQRERLSVKQPPNIICLLAPTTKELQLAEKVTGNLAQLTSQVAPGDVSSVYGIRRAMGIALPLEADEPLIDLTTVDAEPMDTLPEVQQIPVIAV